MNSIEYLWKSQKSSKEWEKSVCNEFAIKTFDCLRYGWAVHYNNLVPCMRREEESCGIYVFTIWGCSKETFDMFTISVQ